MYVSVRQAGVGNRIKSMVSCMRYDPNCRVYWLKAKNRFGRHEGKYSDMFLYPKEITPPFPSNAVIYDSWRLKLSPADGIPKNFNIAYPRKGDPEGNIDFEYERTPKRLISLYASLFAKIQFNPKILARVDKIAEQFDEQTVSIHIRDWHDSVGRQHFYEGLKQYLPVLKSFGPKASFFICSMNQEIIQQLKEALPNNRFITNDEPKITYADDLVDLLLLSRNKTIIGAKFSVFSEVAWWLSGGKAKMIIVPKRNCKTDI